MKPFFYFLLICFLFSSCKNLSEVNSIAKKSTEGLQKFKELNYSFSSNCQDKCYQRALADARFSLEPPSCDCDIEKKADKNLAKLFKALVIYYKALEKLSDDKLVALTLDPVTDPLVKGKYIEEGEIKAYKGLAEKIGAMLTNGYRQKQLTQAIEKAHPDVLVLLKKIQEILDTNLVPTLSTRREELKQVFIDVFSDTLNSNYDRFTIKDRYFKTLNDIEAKEKALKKYSTSLNKVIQGHQTLFDNRNTLNTEASKAAITSLYEQLNEVLTQIK